MVQNSQRGKEVKQFCPTISSDDLCLLFCLNPSSMLCTNRKFQNINQAAAQLLVLTIVELTDPSRYYRWRGRNHIPRRYVETCRAKWAFNHSREMKILSKLLTLNQSQFGHSFVLERSLLQQTLRIVSLKTFVHPQNGSYTARVYPVHHCTEQHKENEANSQLLNKVNYKDGYTVYSKYTGISSYTWTNKYCDFQLHWMLIHRNLTNFQLHLKHTS